MDEPKSEIANDVAGNQSNGQMRVENLEEDYRKPKFRLGITNQQPSNHVQCQLIPDFKPTNCPSTISFQYCLHTGLQQCFIQCFIHVCLPLIQTLPPSSPQLHRGAANQQWCQVTSDQSIFCRRHMAPRRNAHMITSVYKYHTLPNCTRTVASMRFDAQNTM